MILFKYNVIHFVKDLEGILKLKDTEVVLCKYCGSRYWRIFRILKHNAQLHVLFRSDNESFESFVID